MGLKFYPPPCDIRKDYQRCIDENVLLDELIIQDSRMSFGNKSVNTIRLYTIVDTNRKAHIVQAILRVGIGDSIVDNYCSGGCIYPIDLKSGRVDNKGWSEHAGYEGIAVHPGTAVKMVGFQIPYWDKIRSYAIALAEHLPEIRCVGWDIVVADNPFHVDFIEGNDHPHSGLLSMDQKITYQEILYLLDSKCNS